MKQREAAEWAGRQNNIFLKSRTLLKFLCLDSEQFLLARAESVFYIPAWALGSDINDIERSKIGMT